MKGIKKPIVPAAVPDPTASTVAAGTSNCDSSDEHVVGSSLCERRRKNGMLSRRAAAAGHDFARRSRQSAREGSMRTRAVSVCACAPLQLYAPLNGGGRKYKNRPVLPRGKRVWARVVAAVSVVVAVVVVTVFVVVTTLERQYRYKRTPPPPGRSVSQSASAAACSYRFVL